MPVLPKNKHELFAQGLAKGLGIGAAYEAAGYKTSPAAATRLSKNVKIRERVKELQEAAAEKVVLTKQWVLDRLKEIVERTMQAEPVLDREGKPTGEYTFQANGANKALELIGKELGMFVDRLEDDVAVTLRAANDRPPEETREQWLARTARERGLSAPAIVSPSTRSTDGRDDDSRTAATEKISVAPPNLKK